MALQDLLKKSVNKKESKVEEITKEDILKNLDQYRLLISF